MSEQLRILRWETPPAPARNRGTEGRYTGSRYDDITAELRDRLGEWAAIPGGSDIAVIIRTGGYRCFRPAGALEATTRRRDGAQTLYVRYLGDGGGS